MVVGRAKRWWDEQDDSRSCPSQSLSPSPSPGLAHFAERTVWHSLTVTTKDPGSGHKSKT